jgi:hypothetical protein
LLLLWLLLLLLWWLWLLLQGVLVTPGRAKSFFGGKWKLCGVQRVDWRGFATTRYM